MSELAADSVQKAILAQHSARHMKGPKQALPNGIIVSMTPYVGFRHPGEVVSYMLGNPQSIIKKDCIGPGAKYGWLSRRDTRTQQALRSKKARAVTMDEIDIDNDNANVIEIVTPTGSGVVWENMLLVEFSPRAKQLYSDWERWAIAQFATHAEGFAPSVEEATQGAYTGEFTVKDPAKGR